MRTKQELREYANKHYARNKESYKKRANDWKEKNREKNRISAKKYRETHKQQLTEKSRRQWADPEFRRKREAYVAANKEIFNERKREYYRTALGKWALLRNNAKIREISFSIAREDFTQWWNVTERICVYCDMPLFYQNGLRYSSPSVDRKDNSIGYFIENIVMCCDLCNRVKQDFFSYEEMKEIGVVINSIRSRRMVGN